MADSFKISVLVFSETKIKPIYILSTQFASV